MGLAPLDFTQHLPINPIFRLVFQALGSYIRAAGVQQALVLKGCSEQPPADVLRPKAPFCFLLLGLGAVLAKTSRAARPQGCPQSWPRGAAGTGCPPCGRNSIPPAPTAPWRRCCASHPSPTAIPPDLILPSRLHWCRLQILPNKRSGYTRNQPQPSPSPAWGRLAQQRYTDNSSKGFSKGKSEDPDSWHRTDSISSSPQKCIDLPRPLGSQERGQGDEKPSPGSRLPFKPPI